MCVAGSKISVLDFLKMCCNRAFPHQMEAQKKKFSAVLKKLKSQGLPSFPLDIVKNQVAQKYLC